MPYTEESQPPTRGDVWTLEPNLEDKQNRPWLIVRSVDDHPGCAMYGTTQPTPETAGLPVYTVEPDEDNGLEEQTRFVPCVVRPVWATAGTTWLGDLNPEQTVEALKMLRDSLGRGSGPCGPEHGGSQRGYLAGVKSKLKDRVHRFGMIITCHSVSRVRQYEIVVPVTGASTPGDGEYDVPFVYTQRELAVVRSALGLKVDETVVYRPAEVHTLHRNDISFVSSTKASVATLADLDAAVERFLGF